MKQLFALLAFVGLASISYAQSPTSIVFNWQNNNPAVPACSSSVTKGCIVGQTITDVTDTPVVLTSSLSATATTYTSTLPAFTTVTRKYTLVVNYKDASGAAQASGPATCGSGNSASPCTVSVPVVVNPPSGFTATAQ